MPESCIVPLASMSDIAEQDLHVGHLPSQRRYSRAFREQPLTTAGLRAAAPPPTAEAFYFEKQMQQQTPLIIQLEDGEHVDGVLEWHDTASVKLRRTNGARVMIYKHAIKYVHKHASDTHVL